MKRLNEKESLLREREDIIREKELEFKSQEKSIREDAIKRSKSVMLGKMWEQIVPHYRPSDFTFIPSDARFLGSPIDFIVFKGSSESEIEEVIFLEIKTSKSRLNSQQVKLKKLIDSLKSNRLDGKL
jgi:predicted Holliday junction resolvase-like endonuclease